MTGTYMRAISAPRVLSSRIDVSAGMRTRRRWGVMRSWGRFASALLLAAMIALATACGSEDPDQSETATPAATASSAALTPTPTGTRSNAGAIATPSPTASPAPAATQPRQPAAEATRRIVNTSGDGVALRDNCADESRVQGSTGRGFRDGDEVRAVRGGTADCAGWLFVVNDDGRESWVRLRYLSAVDTTGWTGNIATATWGVLFEDLSADERTCVEKALTRAEIEAAARLPLQGPDDDEPWVPRFVGCVTNERFARVTQSATMAVISELGDDPAVTASCYRPFIDELAAGDHSKLFGVAPDQSGDSLLIEARALCSGEALAKQMLAGAGLDPSAHRDEVACIQNDIRIFLAAPMSKEASAKAVALLTICLQGVTAND